MKVLIFGASGMIGQGALLECLDDPTVEAVTVIGRRPCGHEHAKLTEILHEDFFDWTGFEDTLAGHDACLFCLGVSAGGMSEADYTHITYDLTMGVARLLVEVSPQTTLCYVSGQATDSSEQGRMMWARVKGRLENHLLALPLEAYMFRPGFIQPERGIRSSTKAYNAMYAVVGPLFPLLRRVFPRGVTTTGELGRALVRAGRDGHEKKVLEMGDIVELGSD